jgi:ATP-dependent Zn protease
MKAGQTVQLGVNTIRRMMLAFIFGCGVLMIVVVTVRFFSGPLPTRNLSYSDLIQEIDQGNVREATIRTSKVRADVTGHLRKSADLFEVQLQTAEIESLKFHLQQGHIPTTSAEIVEPGSFGYYAFFAGVILFFPVFFFIVIMKMKALKLKSQKLRSTQSQ